ncbi:MAG: S8 family serine peptidase [Planctomycetota bacterium]
MNRHPLFLLTLCLVLSLSGFSQEKGSWDIMTVKEIGVDRFLSEHPEFDGKGVVIAVMDTGVDMGVDGLKTVPNGDVKVVDCRDFTREGDLIWEAGRIVPDEARGEKLIDSKGRTLIGFREVAADAIHGQYSMAFIDEAAFKETAVPDINGDNDTKDQFGVLIFLVKDKPKIEEKHEGDAHDGALNKEMSEENLDEPKDGEAPEAAAEKSGAPEEIESAEETMEEADSHDRVDTAGDAQVGYHYEAVVDINGDGDLADGVRLSDYWRKHQTFVLEGKKGDRKKLTMALNFYPEESRLSVHFDDGGHGTHVAGIAAGYSVHGQKGYNGMAPGARVISLKIGNNRYSGGATVTESVKKALDFGVKYAADHKVPLVFNMSFGIGSERETSSAIDKYVDNLLWKNPGVVFVTSAGNEGPGLSSVGTPGTAFRAISVGALLGPEAAAAQYGCTLESTIPFIFSSRGGDTFKPDIMAQGSAASTVPLWGDRDHFNGTSMASPAAAGGIALLVDALTHHEPPFEIDNLLIHRAVKNTGRHLEGWTVPDEGGGALDLPAAYEYALFLCENKEAEALREYKIKYTGSASGFGAAYWRVNPGLPRKTSPLEFTIEPGFADSMNAETKARFYRAFDLTPDQDWLSLTRPMVYIKGDVPAQVGVMVDLEGKAPGLYTGKIKATRKSEDRVAGAPLHEFDLVVNVTVPYRTTPENRGIIRANGDLEPGLIDRIFVEVPHGITSMAADLRLINGNQAAYLNANLYDPEGVERGGVSTVSEQGQTENHNRIRQVVPGTWEIIISSSIRSRAKADYDLELTLCGLDLGEPIAFADREDTTRNEMLIRARCTQARRFSGNVSAVLNGYVKQERIEVKDADRFSRTIRLDNATGKAQWTIDFDRETYALFTDCVIRVEDVETGDALRNMGIGQRSGTIAITVPNTQKEPKEYRLVLLPAFSLKEDSKQWGFTLTENLTFASGPLKLETISPNNGKISISPWDWMDLSLRMPAGMPAVPEGYDLEMVVEVAENRSKETILQKSYRL